MEETRGKLKCMLLFKLKRKKNLLFHFFDVKEKNKGRLQIESYTGRMLSGSDESTGP